MSISSMPPTAVDMRRESPLWSLTAPPFERGVPLIGEIETDVVIVGGGFLGLSTALHLAEAGIRTVVLEALEPGAGASGRNTGFVIPHVQTPNGPGVVQQAFGPDAGKELIERIGQSADFLFRLIERLGIDCEAEQLGWVQAAHNAEMAAVLERIAGEWQAFGFDAQFLGTEAMETVVGFRRYSAGLKFAAGGQINPLAYVRGLALAAMARGVTLFCGSPVDAVEPHGQAWLVHTATGGVRAARVILAANAGLIGLAPDAKDPLELRHMRQSATYVLDPEAAYRGPIMPFSDTSPHPNLALRRTKSGRLLTGGPPELARERLKRFLPDSQPIEIELTWGGDTAHTEDLMPRYVELAPGLSKAMGCNGRGVAMATTMGALVAAHIVDPAASPWLTRLIHA